MGVQADQKKFLPWADLVRVVATFLVITVHVSGQLTNAWGEIPESDWLIADIYGGIARVCVPLFFMISGYLLLPRSESLEAFYRKRIPKVLIPLVVWSLIYLGWYCGNHPGLCTPPVIQGMLFVQGAYYHLWFLYSLFGIYLILPVLRLLVRPEEDQKILWYLIGLWLIFQSGLTLAEHFWGFKTRFSAPLATGFVGYFFLGHLVGSWKFSRSKGRLIAAAWGLATLVTIWGTYFATRAAGKFDPYFYGFTTPNVIIASVAAFLLLKWTAEAQDFASLKAYDFFRELATAGFGIYLVHVLIIEVLSGFHLDSFMGNPLWSIPLVCTIVFLLSYLIVRIMQRIPVLKRIVP